MRITISKKKLCGYFMALFVLICMLFPADFYNLKKISYIIVLCLSIEPIIQEIKMKTMFAWIGVAYPIALAIASIFVRGEFNGIINGVYCCTMIMLVAPIKRYNINYKKIFLISVGIVGIWTILLFFGDLVGLFNINADTGIRQFIYENNIGYIGKSTSYSFYYKIFIKTCPLVVFLLAYAIENKQYILILLAITVIILSGTRANVGFTAIFFALYLIFDKEFSNRRGAIILKVITVTAFVLAIFIFFNQIVSSIYSVFVTLGSGSDTVRQGHLLGLIELFKRNPLYIFTGTGIGSAFYSYSRGYVTTIEWAYLDLFRQVGIVFFILFMMFVLYPFKRKIPRIYKAAYASYLCIAATNPLLFSSTAFLAYLFMYTIKRRSYEYSYLNEKSGLKST